MIVAEIQFTLLGSAALAILLALAGAAAAWLSYRKTVPPLPAGRRALLTALRASALAAAALLLAEPVMQFVETRTDAPAVALLLDDSRSIRVPGSDHAARLNAFAGAAPSSAPGGAALRFFLFSASVTGAFDAPPESLSFAGQSTNLSAALAEVRRRAREENIRAVVLASDGNYNEGRNPLNELEALALPVFAAGAGDTTRRKDLLVDRVFTNTIAYAGSEVPIEAHLRSFGYDGVRTEVTVSEGGRVAARVPLSLKSETTEYPVTFSVPAGEEGVRKFVVAAAPVAGELTGENNSQTVFVRVLRSRIRVTLFAGAAYPDVAALRQAVAEDPRMEVRSFVQKAPDAFLEGALPQGALDSADCLVFAGFPSALTSDATIGRILAAMRKSKTPLFYVHGKRVDHGKLAAFDEFLPFSVSAPNGAEELVFPSVPARMETHPLVHSERGGVTLEAWERLPPVFKLRTSFRARPGSEVIARAKINTVTLDEPLVVTRSLRGLKSFAVTGHGVYRWRLMAQGSPSTGGFFTAFVSNAVRWLTARENEKQVRVEPVREVFTTADAVAFRAEVYDEQLRPVDDAEVAVRFSAGGAERSLVLGPIGSGRYEGADGPAPAGDYSFTATASRGGRALGTDGGKFSVGPLNVEFLATTMNRRLLEQIGAQSGGGYYDLGEGSRLWADLAARVRLEPREEVSRREVELWNSAWIAGLLVLLLALEWFLRKRWALL